MKKCKYICLDEGGYNRLFTKGNKVYSGYRDGHSEIVVDNGGDYRHAPISAFLDVGIKLHMIYDEYGNYVGGDVKWTI